ncbi:MAG: hypothetical protein IJT23_11275, partial [Clostridia bacterium]|nr:hypothetical protein [Clostridia bacterium]
MKKKLISAFVSAALFVATLPAIALADEPVTVLDGRTVRIEAEDYVAAGNKVNDSVTGRYSNDKAAGSCAVNISVNVPVAGTYTMAVAWGNQYTDNTGFSLTVNENLIYSGKTGKTYGAVAQCFTVDLDAGVNTIAIAQPSQGRVDYLEFTVLNSVNTVRLEAEDYAISRSASDKASNGKFVGNSTFSTSFNVPEAGKYIINPALGTSSGTGGSVTMQLDSGEPIVQTVDATWGSFRKTYEYEVELHKGINTFAVTQSTARVDYIDFVPVATPTPTP